MKNLLFKLSAVCMILLACDKNQISLEQIRIAKIDEMPALPEPYKMIDWHEKAHNFDQYVFNINLEGEFLPFIWIDSTKRNLPQNTFGMFTVIGDIRQANKANYEFHEALTGMGSILGAGLVGIDKRDQGGVNYVKMVQNYFNSDNGWNIMMNNTNPDVALLGGGYGRDWWYDVFPNVLYYAICDLYPEVEEAERLQRTIAEQFLRADSVLNGNYDYSFFDYSTMKGMRNHIPYQQDAAAGHAYVLLCAYERFGEEKYLNGAKSAMEALLSQKESRFYEILMPFGAYTAARLNAEHGTNYDVKKLIDWIFEGCVAKDGRYGWGIVSKRWGNYDTHGLQGSIIDGEGYAFLMNTIDTAWPLIPMVRYDARYATAMGKWMLNAANASRLFYPYEIDDQHQWLPEKKEITKNVIAYEGLRQSDPYNKETLKAITPIALGDGPNWIDGQPDLSMFSLYSSAPVGIFGSIIRKTNVEGILQLNCNVTDFYQKNSYPTYLYYNPYTSKKEVCFYNETGNSVDLYDALTHRYVAQNVSSESCFEISASSASLIAVLPARTKIHLQGNKYIAEGKVVAYK
jgi:hypothetical protein